MSIHHPVNTKGIYFITFTCHNWLPLIEQTNAYDAVYYWFDVLSQKGHLVLGYVIMPNHIHLLLYYSGAHHSLNIVVGNGKRFMAYDIVKRLEKTGGHILLRQLAADVPYKDRQRGKKHEVWIESFDCKICRTEKFILQKLHYIHNNPCQGKWQLADVPHHYPYSSAAFYFNGHQGRFRVKDYREILAMEDFDS